jgi:hypothetical protein
LHGSQVLTSRRQARAGHLEVLGEPSAASEPAEGALDHPPSREQHEALGGIGSFDDFEAPLADPGQGVAQLVAGIAAIGEDVAQPRAQGPDRGQQIDGAVAVLDVGAVDPQAHQVSLRVGDDVAFAAVDFLAGVISPRPAALSSLHRLTVDHPRRGDRLAPHPLA